MDRNNSVNKELDEDSENDDELRIEKYRVRFYDFFFTLRTYAYHGVEILVFRKTLRTY